MLDVNYYDPAKVLKNSEILLDFESKVPDEENFPPPLYTLLTKSITFQCRYVVHRQNIGFFTPMVFDLRLRYYETNHNSAETLTKILYYAEPFIEGALFMNHESQFIVDMLKGQEHGIQRQDYLIKLRKEISGSDKLWYSDWLVPPPTKQSQRIVIYDLDKTCSMLNPYATSLYLINLINKAVNPVFTMVYEASIVSGYQEIIP